ncbi:MAG: glutamate--tRNA ligase [Firmicutes bacterium]|nr:glutamate--tRNA ligase [Bacillota bacterium]
MSEKIRVRFAPSPTGYLHIGGARTALFNWLFARKAKGIFVLRIEDTDIDRSTLESEEKILEDMKWLGMDWDEGPDTGGPFGPYRQSERLNSYLESVRKLIDEGRAYPCYCTEEELKAKREESLSQHRTPRYDGKCRNLSKEEIKKLEAGGRKPAIRFKIKEGQIIIDDMVKGKVSFKGEEVSGDFIILKSDGTPSYNFAVVVDDVTMGITHVIRGDEHLNNTPRQMMLYEALGFSLPSFGHLSMILAPDHTKLSKRHGTTAVGEFREKGYLPQAILNYIALLGWAPHGEQEFFSLEELVENFSLDRVALNAAVFDITKLKWMNAHYIKEMEEEKLAETVLSYILDYHEYLNNNPDLKNVDWKFFEEADKSSEAFNLLKELVSMLKESIFTLDDFVYLAKDFLPSADENFAFETDAFETLSKPESKIVLDAFKAEIEASPEITSDNLKSLIQAVQKNSGKKGKDLYMPVRAVSTGKLHGPEIAKLFPLLGKERILKRLEYALNKALPAGQKN